MLGLKQTRACVLKNQAEKQGYIKTRPHYQLIMEFDQYRPKLLETLRQGLSDVYHKCQIKTRKTKTGRKYQLVMQLHDEIIPLLECRRINYYRKVKQKSKRSRLSVKKPKASLS